jgi:hypothetical protein
MFAMLHLAPQIFTTLFVVPDRPCPLTASRQIRQTCVHRGVRIPVFSCGASRAVIPSEDQKFSGIFAKLDGELQICRSLSGTARGVSL